jgi:CBS domain-containing protein
MITLEQMMSKPVLTISQDKNIAQAAAYMKSKNISAIVVAEKGKLLGIATEKDILRKVVAKNLKPSTVKISSIMTKKLITADIGSDIFTVSKMMDQYNIRRMLITKEGKLVGIITTKDLLKLTSL